MSLSNVLLLHVSTAFLPRNEAERQAEQREEFYTILDLHKYASSEEIRRAHRRATLKLDCDRTMLQYKEGDTHHGFAKKALKEREEKIQKAYRVLGQRHLRQQYHLSQCRPSRYKVMQGEIAFYNRMTSARRWFPFLVLQAVLIAAMVNATVAGAATKGWVIVLVPTWAYLGLTCLFWLVMFLKIPLRRQCTLRSCSAMFSAFAQFACFWLGSFYTARKWDRETGENISWALLSIPFYLAVLFRCYCSWKGIRSLRELQSKMISRKKFEQTQQPKQQQEEEIEKDSNAANRQDVDQMASINENDGSHRAIEIDDGKHDNSAINSDDCIVVTMHGQAFMNYIQSLPLSDNELAEATSHPEKLEQWCVESSPEYKQVEGAALALRYATLKLAFLSLLFITMLVLKLEGYLDINFWLVFLPVWIVLGGNLLQSAPATTRRPFHRPAQNNNYNTPEFRREAFQALLGNRGNVGDDNNALTSKEQSGSEGELPSGAPADENNNLKDTDKESAREYDIEANFPVVKVKSIGAGDATTLDTGLAALAETVNNTTQQDKNAAVPDPSNTRQEPSQLENNEDDSAEETSDTDSNQREDDPENMVHEEFERWQSVYETTETNTMRIRNIPVSTLFAILTVCLLVAKLDTSYANDDPGDVGFDAFLVILVPFSVAISLCCCAILAGCVELALEDSNNPRTNSASSALPVQLNDWDHDNQGETENTPPMQAGTQSPSGLTFSEHLDVLISDFTLPHHVQLLMNALPISKEDAEAWALKNVRDPISLWGLVTTCADDLDCHSVNQEAISVSEDFPTFSDEWWALLRKNLEAYFDRSRFQNELDAIEPLDSDDNNDNTIDSDAGDGTGKPVGLECQICYETFNVSDIVPCQGNPIHFFCCICFHRYATETVKSGGIAGMPCADPTCPATFATPTVQSNVSKWEILRMKDREDEINTKVALAAKSVLKCTCGAVAIVMEDDIGDGCITCPGPDCTLQFCAKCGNFWHPDLDCPPTKKVLQWVVKNTMPCPNCHTPIEKNAGCDHMFCAPPGGCGYDFSYRTGKPMSKTGRYLPDMYH